MTPRSFVTIKSIESSISKGSFADLNKRQDIGFILLRLGKEISSR